MNFLDSNIWLYAFLEVQDIRKHRIAKDLIAKGGIAVSQQIIGEVCKALLRKSLMDEFEIQEIVHMFYKRFNPLTLDEKDMILGSQLRLRYRFEHWDSLIVTAALRSKASILYSEDMQDGLVIEGTLQIVNPFNAL